MTYSTEEKSAMDSAEAAKLPTWMKFMRFLVLTLLMVSIIAMIAVGWAAFRLVSTAMSTSVSPSWESELILPPDAEPLSYTRLESGGYVVIYQSLEGYRAQIYDATGAPKLEAVFE